MKPSRIPLQGGSRMGCTEEQLRKYFIELDMPRPGTVIFLIYTFYSDGHFIGPKRIGY